MSTANSRSGNLQAAGTVGKAPVSRESILCTDELNLRPSRAPDYKTENRALVALAQALADSPQTILQTLADTILEVFQCDSAGLSLLTTNDGGKRFYWPAIAGQWKPHIGGGTPRDFGPCGDVLDSNRPLMFRHFEKFYTYLPPIEECLLVPFYVEGKAVGTIWAISQGHRRKFDAEDMRQLVSLGRFASAAYQAVTTLKTKAQLAAIVESSDDAIMSTDLNGIILSWNAGAERLFGYTAEEAVGQSVTMVIPLDRLDEEPRILERIRRGEYTQYETVRHRKDGTLVDISLSISPIIDAFGKIVGASKIARDIAERKRAEEALRLSHVSLEHLVEQRTGSLLAIQAELARVHRVAIIGELTVSIAHEVNQPLAGIVANADACMAWLSAPQPDLDEAKKAAGGMILAATRASEVIARIRSLITKTTPERLKLNINEVIEEAVALARTETMNNNVSLVTELASDLPVVLGDRIQLQQVILNLAMNGIAAMSSVNDRPRRLLIWSQTQDADRVLVAVQDFGAGMSPDVMARLFEPFFTTRSQGIGMGLPISRSIIEGHGGRLWAESTVSRGSTFQFTLPIEACDVS